MKYNSIGEQLIAKAQELDPNYKPDKFNDMSEAIDVILNNSGSGSAQLYLDILPYITFDDETKENGSITQEGFDLIQTKLNHGEIIGVSMGGESLTDFLYFDDNPVDGTSEVQTILTVGINYGHMAMLKLNMSSHFLRWNIFIEPILNIPQLPSDADTKTYVLKAVNGVLTWSE